MPSPTKEQMRISAGAARLYFVVALVSGLVLLSSHVFDRIELQTINSRFELRRWIDWAPSSLTRLNLARLWQYHEQHEIPRQWWAWDYTLSWLIENNHPVSSHKFVLFNHQLEDEPPLEALQDHPWMKPLVSYPLSRACVGDILIFLAKSGARLIIMDNDFPQFSADDPKLAQAILDCRDGVAAGHVVPVLMARTINHHSSNNILQLEIPTAPSGLLKELSKKMQGVDPLEELTGSTGVTMDEDQVVRRLASHIPTIDGGTIDSITIKALKATGETVPQNVPNFMDIDFAGPPNSEIYPIRPISYLLDPARQKEMSRKDGSKGDVSLQGAIVILGDSVVDVFNTPTTNLGVNQMSGAEILANSIDTISRKSWFYRLDFLQQLGYLFGVCSTGAWIFYVWKTRIERGADPIANLPSEKAARGKSMALYSTSGRRLFSEFLCFVIVIVGSYLLAAFLFSRAGLIVPLVVPVISLTLASLASLQWEREQEKMAAVARDLKAARDRLALQDALHKAELDGQKSLSEAREAALDKERRKEFARRINHDLRAPVSVLSWTIAKLRGKRLTEEEKQEKIDRLSKTADRMFALINELVSTYNSEDQSKEAEEASPDSTNIKEVLLDSVKIQQVLAEQHSGTIKLQPSPDDCFVEASHLQLSRVVDNIIRNAFLHNAPGVNVEVSLTGDGRNNEIQIKDDGKGIAAEHLDKIFTPGYRVDKKIDQAAADGQGLGLDIVHSFVENMKGSVSVKSTVGEGTTFIITLPTSARTRANPPSKALADTAFEENENIPPLAHPQKSDDKTDELAIPIETKGIR